jgi:hypothetical protein
VPRPVQVLKIDRDEGGIVVTGDVGASVEEAVVSAPAPVEIESREAAEKLGFTITAERQESFREIGDGLFAKQDALFAGEWCGSFREQPPRTFHFQAPTLEGLLKQFGDFENRRRNQ